MPPKAQLMKAKAYTSLWNNQYLPNPAWLQVTSISDTQLGNLPHNHPQGLSPFFHGQIPKILPSLFPQTRLRGDLT